MKKIQKFLYLFLALLLLAALLSGCRKAEDPFQVMFAAPYASDEEAAAFGAGLTLESQTPVRYVSFCFGSEDVDPMTYGGGVMAMTAMLVAGEVDVLVCELGEAARYAQSGCFYSLAEIFSPEELAACEASFLTFDILDAYGVPTGEKTPACGLDLSGREELTRILGDENYGIFIVAGTEDLDTATEVFWKIVNS